MQRNFPLRTIIVDNDIARGQKLRAIIEGSTKRVRVAAVCKHSTEALISTRYHRPDFLILDLSPDSDVERLKREHNNLPALFTTQDTGVAQSLRNSGYHAISWPVKYSHLKHALKKMNRTLQHPHLTIHHAITPRPQVEFSVNAA